MHFYQEITLIKSPDISPYFIWSKLYTQVHLALVEQQNPDKTVNFGVSFPEYSYQNKEGKKSANIGSILRIFAPTERELQQLYLSKWLERLTDYAHIKSIQSAPENVNSYLLVKRYRANTNLERLTRRFMQRESKRTGKEISFEEAKAIQQKRFADTHGVSLQQAENHYHQPQVKNFPFIKMKSYSGSKEFSLQIEQVVASQSQQGTFSTYGLSSKNTVPQW